MIKNIFSYRKLIWDFVLRDFRSRYAGSSMGIFWNIAQPVIMILIYSLVFSKIMKTRLPASTSGVAYNYAIYLCSGLLAWIAFAESIQRSTTVFLENANLIKKIFFPTEILNAYIVVSSFLNLMISLGVFFLFLIAIGYPLTLLSLISIGIAVFQQLFAFGVGLILSCLTVFFRDISPITSVFTQFWFWCTPIVYVKEILPAEFIPILKFNPMFYFITSYQNLILFNKLPDKYCFICIVFIPVFSLLIGYVIFRALKEEIPDQV